MEIPQVIQLGEAGSTPHGAQCPWCLQWGGPGPGPVVTRQAGAVTMLMKLGLFNRPAMSKLPTPPVCGVRKALVSGASTQNLDSRPPGN